MASNRHPSATYNWKNLGNYQELLRNSKQNKNTESLPVFSLSILPIVCICLTFLGSGRLIRRELSPPFLADIIISCLQLPGELVNRRGLVFGGPVQLADIVAVLGRVILHGSISGAFMASQLQDGEDSSKLADHPVLKPEQPEDAVNTSVHTNAVLRHVTERPQIEAEAFQAAEKTS